MEETPFLTCVMQIEQEILHLHGPLLMLLLGNCRTIAHEVGSTDTVSTRIGIIAHQSVVHASPGKVRPDADLVHCLPAARRMPGQMRKARGCSSHAANAASHTRGCRSHLHAGVGWPRAVRQCAQPSEPAARLPVHSTAARWLPRSGTHRSPRAPRRCEHLAAIAPGADTRPTLAGGDHTALAR